MKGNGNLSLPSVEGPKSANRCIFMAVKKKRKLPGLVTYSYFRDDAFTAVKRDAAF